MANSNPIARISSTLARRAHAMLGNAFQPSPAYEAGSVTGPRMSGWRAPNGGPNATARGSHGILRARSRDKRRNDGHANTIVEVLVANIVGTGIKPQFKTGNAAFNRELAQRFADWAQECDADGVNDFYGQQALAVGSMLEGGDCFARLRLRRPEDNLGVPLQIQLLEGEYCPTEYNKLLPGGAYVMQGVEFGPIGNRQAYYLWRMHPNDVFARTMSGAQNLQPLRVKAQDVIHLAMRKRPGQIRGEPHLVRALIKLFDLDKYDDAQLVRQQVAAMFAGFVKNASENPFAEGADDLPDEDDGDVVFPSLEAGTMQSLDPNTDVTFSEPPSPGDSFEAYMRHQERRIAASGGIMYEQLTGDWTQINDRTYRAAVNEQRRRLRMLQNQVVFQFCRPALARWLAVGTLSGAIEFPPDVQIADVLRTRWTPQAWDYINPLQDVEARRNKARAGLTSRAKLVSEDGDDVDALDEEIARDNDRADSLGLVFDSDARYTNQRGASQQTPQAILPDAADAAAQQET